MSSHVTEIGNKEHVPYVILKSILPADSLSFEEISKYLRLIFLTTFCP
jgi:hypothetical protein